MFQSPCGGRGRSDTHADLTKQKKCSFNHLAVAGVGQTFLNYVQSSRAKRFNHLTVAGVGQTGNIAYLCNWKGQRFNHLTVAGVGQTSVMIPVSISILRFQSPYGGRGRSDMSRIDAGRRELYSFNHLTVAGVGQTVIANSLQCLLLVSITLRWQG